MNWLAIISFAVVIAGCTSSTGKNTDRTENSTLLNVEQQLSLLLATAEEANKNPRTLDEDGEIHWATKAPTSNRLGGFDWTLGFFPGSCWYMYEYTQDEKWKNAAIKFQGLHENFKDLTGSHDLGFVFNCSYGNAYRLTKEDKYKQVMIDAGDALIQRFNPAVGCIQSWDVDKGWQATRGWRYPVIIDNMMNLELLFELSKLTGDDKYKKVAISHADKTLQNHFRADNSSYHVVDYDPETGAVRKKNTAQGYAHESAWARGQAWGLYGYVVCYRYTKDPRYLEQAVKIADFIRSFDGAPKDGIPYWDYQAPEIPNEPRDVSAAAITASALIELNEYTKDAYEPFENKLMSSLASPDYTARAGEVQNFVLKHSVGSIPHNNEIDVPLNYADYYYIEALVRQYKLSK